MPTFSFSPGHEVVGRYRITEALGIGSTAEVYVAEDPVLHRTVAVKFLLPQLAAFEDVRRAFREQIIRAATLNHAHLARVYDGGQESGSIFMVTEYFAGGTLEDVLAAGRRLDVDDAAKLGRDVASTLAYLHANDITLGTLSPRKILIDDQGGVRVSDVALAGLRARHPGQWSRQDVRYLSPEQARGEPATPQSDVYALALILFEVVTGDSPFEAMSADEMLRARIDNPLPIRAELGALDMMLAQAAVPDATLRLSAEQFANRLGGAIADAAPLAIATTRGSVPLLAGYQPAEPRTSIGFRPPSADQIAGSSHESPPDPTFPRAQPSRRAAHASASDATRAPRRAEPYPVVPPPRRRRSALVVGAVLVVALAGGAVWKLGFTTSSVTVPSLVGLTTAQATSQVSSDGLSVDVARHEHSPSVPAKQIITQTPAAGSAAKSGSSVAVTVSDGPLLVTVPSVLGQSCAAATTILAHVKVVGHCPTSAAVVSTVPIGQVVEVLYRGHVDPAQVPQGSSVVLAMSRGPVPSSPTTSTATSTTTPSGSTTSTTVPATAAGPRPVPNVIGMGQAQTIAAFRKAVLFFRPKGPGSATLTWTKVVSTIPAPGTLVPYRSTIIVNVK